MSEQMDEWLRQPSTVDLRQLKTGRLSVFVVIPTKKLSDQGQFLRLFTQSAVSLMQDRLELWPKLGDAG